MTTVVLVPGYTNAGPAHWQTIIERKYADVVRVQQDNWEVPDREKWLTRVNETLSTIEGEVVLVGHSCGAVAITQWSQAFQSDKVIGALLVAPADVDSPSAIVEIQVQRPLSFEPLPFPSIVVTSDNDAHVSLERAHLFADAWRSEIIIKPGADHFHTEAGYGEWPEGEKLIERLMGRSFQCKSMV
ncbi:RBBP9/YdeN family alpha/beta hydrolase [Thaumasiovibrio subtropicus]|uniref:RBBP9/YdeN family alpha/beta hydrolase n=1 Tax=Thaumasiovibrio subtropicus TaxID=1891207 RepID=UPI000B35151E|nr:alpha/beta fold hydrolase [Thaumasiovibrio subtropicus]